MITTRESIMKLTRLASGEYEFKGGSISKDENEANLWWLRVDGYNVAEDFRTLKEAKLAAKKLAIEYNEELGRKTNYNH